MSVPGGWAGAAAEQRPHQVGAAEGHGEVERGQGVHVPLVQGEVVLTEVLITHHHHKHASCFVQTSISFSSFSKLLSRTAWCTAPTPAEVMSSSSSINAASL